MQTPRNVVCKRMGTSGWYHHFGLKYAVLRTLNLLQIETIPAKLKIFIHVDGFPVS